MPNGALDFVAGRAPGWQTAAVAAGLRPVTAFAARYLEVRADTVARAVRVIDQTLDDVAERLRDGRRYLGGDRFSSWPISRSRRCRPRACCRLDTASRSRPRISFPRTLERMSPAGRATPQGPSRCACTTSALHRAVPIGVSCGRPRARRDTLAECSWWEERARRAGPAIAACARPPTSWHPGAAEPDADVALRRVKRVAGGRKQERRVEVEVAAPDHAAGRGTEVGAVRARIDIARVPVQVPLVELARQVQLPPELLGAQRSAPFLPARMFATPMSQLAEGDRVVAPVHRHSDSPSRESTPPMDTPAARFRRPPRTPTPIRSAGSPHPRRRTRTTPTSSRSSSAGSPACSPCSSTSNKEDTTRGWRSWERCCCRPSRPTRSRKSRRCCYRQAPGHRSDMRASPTPVVACSPCRRSRQSRTGGSDPPSPDTCRGGSRSPSPDRPPRSARRPSSCRSGNMSRLSPPGSCSSSRGLLRTPTFRSPRQRSSAAEARHHFLSFQSPSRYPSSNRCPSSSHYPRSNRYPCRPRVRFRTLSYCLGPCCLRSRRRQAPRDPRRSRRTQTRVRARATQPSAWGLSWARS